MTADDNSPSNGENGSGESIDWEELGRTLLAEGLERTSGEVYDAFQMAARKADDGEQLTERDVEALWHSADRARELAVTVQEAHPGFDLERARALAGE